jgi:hypothetical protein
MQNKPAIVCRMLSHVMVIITHSFFFRTKSNPNIFFDISKRLHFLKSAVFFILLRNRLRLNRAATADLAFM